MEKCKWRMKKITNEFKGCQKAFLAVSHHLRILKDAGMINMRREGTKNYYFLDASESQWKRILDLVGVIYESAKDIESKDPRKEEKW